MGPFLLVVAVHLLGIAGGVLWHMGKAQASLGWGCPRGMPTAVQMPRHDLGHLCSLYRNRTATQGEGEDAGSTLSLCLWIKQKENAPGQQREC